jgi:hypothetical protein
MRRITVIVLITVNIALCAICYTQFTKESHIYTDSLKELTEQIAYRERDLSLRMVNDNRFLEQETEVIGLDGEKHLLKDIVKERSLVMRFSEEHCDECVRYFLLKLMRLSSELKIDNQIILLASYHNKRSLSVLLQGMKVSFPTYLVDSITIPCEEIHYPYCFWLDKDLHVDHLFIPDKAEPKMADLYLKIISIRYFDKKNDEQNSDMFYEKQD